jgi:hypothetical protein
MNKNAIVYLVRSDEASILELNTSLNSLYSYLAATVNNADLIIFHESDFGILGTRIDFRSDVFGKIIFCEVDLGIPSETIKNFGGKIEKFFPHPTHGIGPIAYGHPGFSIGYRSMCRFFSGSLYHQPILKEYKYYLRLDTDSRFEDGPDLSLFDWAEGEKINYGYIAGAVQIDDSKVVKGLKTDVLKYMLSKFVWRGVINSLFIPKGKMFYTNFELGRTDFFIKNAWDDFFRYLDESGGFYIHRWGDAPIKYVGVKSLSASSKIKPIPPGFVYTHGSTYLT